MYENGKMRPVEGIVRMGGGGIKENEGVNSTKISTFINATMYPQYNSMIINFFFK
jgi:hypothetical protein